MASQNNLNAVFTDIANAIRDKKGSVNTIKPINMADEILTIETKSTIYKTLESRGTDWTKAFWSARSYENIVYYMTELSENDIPSPNNVVNMINMFNGCKNLTTIPLFDTSSCTKMASMFSGCKSLTSIPQFDTSKAVDMNYMFAYCSKLTTIPPLDTSSCTDMSLMFRDCTALTTITQLDTSKVSDMSSMCYNCTSLTTIPQLNTNSCTKMDSMFSECHVLEKIDITKLADSNGYFAYSCYSLKTLIIRTMDTIPTLNSNTFEYCFHFYGTTNATYNPNGLKDGRIYVPDDKVEALKTATNWSVFADIIKPLSEYVE